MSDENIDEFLIQNYENKHHLKTSCDVPTKTCPTNYACRIETKLCESEDILPATSWINVDDIHVTGTGKELLNYILSRGYTLDDVYNWSSNRQLIKAVEEIEKDNPSRSEGVPLPIFPSKRITYLGIDINTTLWPTLFAKETQLLLSFFSVSQQIKLMNWLNKKLYTSIQLTEKEKILPPLQCLLQLILDENIVRNGLNIDDILIFRNDSETTDNLPNQKRIVMLTLGHHTLLKTSFKNNYVEIPCPAGSLISFFSDKNTRISLLSETKYHPQKRINICFIFVK